MSVGPQQLDHTRGVSDLLKTVRGIQGKQDSHFLPPPPATAALKPPAGEAQAVPVTSLEKVCHEDVSYVPERETATTKTRPTVTSATQEGTKLLPAPLSSAPEPFTFIACQG